jgi:hypothetical protein
MTKPKLTVALRAKLAGKPEKPVGLIDRNRFPVEKKKPVFY